MDFTCSGKEKKANEEIQWGKAVLVLLKGNNETDKEQWVKND